MEEEYELQRTERTLQHFFEHENLSSQHLHLQEQPASRTCVSMKPTNYNYTV